MSGFPLRRSRRMRLGHCQSRAPKATLLLVAVCLVSYFTTVSATAVSARGARASHPVASAARDHGPLANAVSRATLDVMKTTGQVNGVEPSGKSPPSAVALPGYAQTYVSDFTGSSLPSGWSVFTGTPRGDPGGQWASDHVVVGGGLLQLNTWKDPAYNNEWVTGGLCQCSTAKTYGAYFVRSRMTGPGPTQVELLWPIAGWPPEIDFNETYGAVDLSMATTHFDAANDQEQRTVNIDMTQWHTWGVVWTPTSISYTVDGNIWGIVTTPAAIPNQPMTLDLQQQTWCSANWACPSSPQSMQVDWVAEYTQSAKSVHPTRTAPTTRSTSVVSPFAFNSATLSQSLKAQVSKLAARIKARGGVSVSLIGYGDGLAVSGQGRSISRARAVAVAAYLRKCLAALHVTGVSIAVTSQATASALTSKTLRAATGRTRRVVARIS